MPRRILAAVLPVVILAACHAWHPVPEDTIAAGRPQPFARLLVVTRDGYELQLRDATIRADSIVGTAGDSTPPRRLAIAHDNVVRVESQEADPKPVLREIGGWLLDTGKEFYRLLVCVLSFGRLCVT